MVELSVRKMLNITKTENLHSLDLFGLCISRPNLGIFSLFEDGESFATT